MTALKNTLVAAYDDNMFNSVAKQELMGIVYALEEDEQRFFVLTLAVGILQSLLLVALVW